MTKIAPTEGRIVWFYGDMDMPRQAAIITGVNDEGVELWVFPRAGSVYSGGFVVRSILDPDEVESNTYFATWMPYQKGQAAKTEALEAQLGQI